MPDSAAETYTEFLAGHGLTRSEWTDSERSLINAVGSVRAAYFECFSRGVDHNPEDPSLGILLNLLERAYEHFLAAEVCWCTGRPASTEVIVRSIIEISMKLRYICAGNSRKRIAAFFQSFVADCEKKTSQWESSIGALSPSDQQVHRSEILERKEYNAGLRKFAHVLDANGEVWPKDIRAMFVEMREETLYRTVYWRLSSQTHGDAEDTLTYFGVKSFLPPESFDKHCQEVVMFSHFLLSIGARELAIAAKSYAALTGHSQSLRELKRLSGLLENMCVSASAHV